MTDKLHKLYSTTNPTAVWARSTGLEVLNELDSLKGALMSAAGGAGGSGINSGISGRNGTGWSGVAATGLEGVIHGVAAVKAVASGVGSVVGAAAVNLFRQAANSKS